VSESTVTVGHMELTSNTESAADMAESLKSEKAPSKEPRITQDKGKAVESPDPELSAAARELGKKGGEAKARKEEKSEEKVEAKPEEKPQEKAEGTPEEKGRAKARIERLARERSEERQRRIEVEQRLAEIEAERAAPAAERRGAAPEGKPKAGDFESDADYFEALAEWKAKELFEARERQTRAQTETRALVQRDQETLSQFDEHIRTATEAEPEWLETVDEEIRGWEPTFVLPPNSQRGPHNDIAEAIVRSEHPNVLMKYLTAHPEEKERLLSLPDSNAVQYHMGRLEERITFKPAALAEKPKSNAPPPIKPLATSSVPGEPDIYGDDVDFETFLKRKKSMR